MPQDLQDDTTATIPSSQWFDAAAHFEVICHYVDHWQGPQDLHAVDVFSCSKSIMKAFRSRFYRAESYDVKTSVEMDVVKESGWYYLLDLCLRLSLGLGVMSVIGL